MFPLREFYPKMRRLTFENIEIVKHLNYKSFTVIDNYTPNYSFVELVLLMISCHFVLAGPPFDVLCYYYMYCLTPTSSLVNDLLIQRAHAIYFKLHAV